MCEDSTTGATVVMFCNVCRRQFVIPLDDFEDLPSCILCGAPKSELEALPPS